MRGKARVVLFSGIATLVAAIIAVFSGWGFPWEFRVLLLALPMAAVGTSPRSSFAWR
jgi:hypothetical protein